MQVAELNQSPGNDDWKRVHFSRKRLTMQLWRQMAGHSM